MQEPGWYPDPLGSTELRRWDGSAWTEDVRAGGPHDVVALEATVDPAERTGAAVGANATDRPRGRRRWVVGVVVAVLLLLVALAIPVLLGDDEGSPPQLAIDRVSEDATAPDEERPEEPEGQGSDGPAPVEPAEDPAMDDPLDDPAMDDPAMDDPAMEDPAARDAPAGSGRAVDDEEAVAALSGYVQDLDRLDLSAAHARLSPDLRSRPGWSLVDFDRFWTDRLAGASVVSIDGVRVGAARTTVEAVLDYRLQDGATSRERVLVEVGEIEGRVLIDRYVVESSTRTGG